MRKIIWLLVLLCCHLAGAAAWTNAGPTWSRGTDVTMTLPEGLVGEETENGLLIVKHPSGALVVSFGWASSEQEAAAFTQGYLVEIKKLMPDVKFSEPRSVNMDGGQKLTIQDTVGTLKENQFDVTVGTVSKGPKALCFFSLILKAKLDELSKQFMNPLMDSIKFS